MYDIAAKCREVDSAGLGVFVERRRTGIISATRYDIILIEYVVIYFVKCDGVCASHIIYNSK